MIVKQVQRPSSWNENYSAMSNVRRFRPWFMNPPPCCSVFAPPGCRIGRLDVQRREKEFDENPLRLKSIHFSEGIIVHYILRERNGVKMSAGSGKMIGQSVSEIMPLPLSFFFHVQSHSCGLVKEKSLTASCACVQNVVHAGSNFRSGFESVVPTAVVVPPMFMPVRI